MMKRRNRVSFRPAVEGVEARLLLSAARSLLASARPHQAERFARAAIDPATIPPNPLFFPTGQPTPHEAVRQRFTARFSGPYLVGPGRFSTDAQQIYIRGLGGSTDFLHGDTQLAVITPTDPTQPLGGAMTMFDRNINTGSSIGLELVADRSSGVDAAGRPVHLTIYQVKSEESSGAYASAIAVGTVDIRYKPSSNRTRGVISQGTATVTVRAQIYTSGTNGSFRNLNLKSG